MRRRCLPAAPALAGLLLGLAPALWTASACAAGTMMQAPAPPAITLPTEQPTPDTTSTQPLINPAIQFNRTERWLIPDYFIRIRDRQRRATRYKSYPRDLPAGLEKRPAIGEILQPAILATMEPLPKPLLLELPAPRPDTRRYIAGQDVLLVQPSSGKVLDILNGVLH